MVSDKCSSVYVWLPGTIAMPTTICINRHADHQGISGFQPRRSPGFTMAIANSEIEVKTVNGFMDSKALGLLGEVRQCAQWSPWHHHHADHLLRRTGCSPTAMAMCAH